MFHIVATANMPNLILNVSEEAVWQHLEATTTTPIKREWMTWIVPGLKAMKKIQVPAVSVGCNVGLCFATDEDLDRLVSAAVKSHRVSIR